MNPKFNSKEYGGYLFESCGRHYNPILMHGQARKCSIITYKSMPVCMIHSHPGPLNFIDALPSVMDFKSALNEGYQIVVNEYGIIVYSICGYQEGKTAEDAFLWDDERLRAASSMTLERLKRLRPYVDVRIINWKRIALK